MAATHQRGLWLSRIERARHAARHRRVAPPLAPKQPHFPAKAKRVLFLCMDGGPSHVDSFDYKLELVKYAGKPIGKGKVPAGKLMAPVWEFKQRGQSGLWISELFP